MDKRIEKTMSRLSSALIQLSSKKDYQSISVSELCRKAGVNKSTFYLHFSNIDDFAAQMPFFIARHVLEVDSFEKPKPPSKEVIASNILLFLQENTDACLELYSSPFFSKTIYDFKQNMIRSIIRKHNLSINENPVGIIAAYFAISGMIDTAFFVIISGDEHKSELLEALVKSVGEYNKTVYNIIHSSEIYN